MEAVRLTERNPCFGLSIGSVLPAMRADMLAN